MSSVRLQLYIRCSVPAGLLTVVQIEVIYRHLNSRRLAEQVERVELTVTF